MAVVNRKRVLKNGNKVLPSPESIRRSARVQDTIKGEKETVDKFTAVEEKTEPQNRFFKAFHIAKGITKEGEYYAEVTKWEVNDYGNRVILTPYLYDDSGKKIIYEDVFLRIQNNCPDWSAGAKFLKLFADARHWGDVYGRIIGIKIKFNTKNETVYKNVVDVFITDEDTLIFDDEHIPYGACSVGGKKVTKDTDEDSEGSDVPKLNRKSRMAALLEDEEDEDELTDDIEAEDELDEE